MGSPKPLLEWHGQKLLEYQMEQLLAMPEVAEVVVVLGHMADDMRPLVKVRRTAPKVSAIINPDYRQGKSTSIRAGLSALTGKPAAIMIIAVDQPRPSGVLRELVRAHLLRQALISVPFHGGRRGHPPVFSAALLPELLAVSEEQEGLREVLRRHGDAVQEVPMDSPLVLTDLNTDEDYRRALARDLPPAPFLGRKGAGQGRSGSG